MFQTIYCLVLYLQKLTLSFSLHWHTRSNRTSTMTHILDIMSVTVSPSSLTLCLFPGCRLWGRRSRGTRRGRGGERRTSSFTSWPRCCRCRAPSPASWTRPPSSGSPSATWRWETSPTRATRRGTCAWRDRRPTPPSKVGGTWRTGFVVRPD